MIELDWFKLTDDEIEERVQDVMSGKVKINRRSTLPMPVEEIK